MRCGLTFAPDASRAVSTCAKNAIAGDLAVDGRRQRRRDVAVLVDRRVGEPDLLQLVERAGAAGRAASPCSDTSPSPRPTACRCGRSGGSARRRPRRARRWPWRERTACGKIERMSRLDEFLPSTTCASGTSARSDAGACGRGCARDPVAPDGLVRTLFACAACPAAARCRRAARDRARRCRGAGLHRLGAAGRPWSPRAGSWRSTRRAGAGADVFDIDARRSGLRSRPRRAWPRWTRARRRFALLARGRPVLGAHPPALARGRGARFVDGDRARCLSAFLFGAMSVGLRIGLTGTRTSSRDDRTVAARSRRARRAGGGAVARRARQRRGRSCSPACCSPACSCS